MPLVDGRWHVVSGDCLWNIADSVYDNPYKWTEIADANGISQRTHIIYPGQILDLPGVTPGSEGTPPTPEPTPPAVEKVRIDWFSLRAGSEREMEVAWSWGGLRHFYVKWEYYDANGRLWVQQETTNYAPTGDTPPQATCTYGDNAKKCRLSIRPVKEDGSYQDNTDWAVQEYDFANNPPKLPPEPSMTIDNQNVMTITMSNIDPDINADSIEIAIYQDDEIKYKTAKATINTETHYIRYVTNVDPGHYYKIRCRAVRGDIYGGWTNTSENEYACPVAPTKFTELRSIKISEQAVIQYGVSAKWEAVPSAITYEVQWTTNIAYFDSGSGVESQTTEEGQGPSMIITDIEVGHEYFFRVRSINSKGNSADWSAISSLKIGTKPSAPTTWSNTVSAVIGEDLNLYWTHNSTDGSLETFARLRMEITDSAHPSAEPTIKTKVIENTKPEEQQGSPSVYTINTDDPEWAFLSNGFIIKWKVQTSGVTGEYSDWSVEREVVVYSKPELSLDITNRQGTSVEEISEFPFHISILATPPTQTPISYYIEVVANEGYTTVDNVGNVKTINPGDKVYQKYYDPEQNAWRFLLEMTPANIDLQNGISYTVNAMVSMNSGLIAYASKDFDVIFSESGYLPYGNVTVDKETLTASINPYCLEYYEEGGELLQRLTENCTLAVYRREYDGTFTEIATGIENSEDTYVVDPHPSLDYARYRIVAVANDTGAISYNDVEAVKVAEPSIVIQWAAKWSQFDYDDSSETALEPAWSGSMLKIPYNVDVTNNATADVSLVKYAGRQHPVSYYGTHIDESANWNCEIPADDVETLYAIRRLAIWTGNVYVREPSGVGYWANIKVNYSKKHLGVTIPVSFEIKRVEGGM